MRFITTRFHGYLDYMMAALLIISPWLFGFHNNGPATWVPIILGAGVIMYSLLTDYELGARHAISMKGHLALDFMGGVFLAASPWLFGFDDYVYLPHLILGIAEIGAAMFTKSVPSYKSEQTVTRSW